MTENFYETPAGDLFVANGIDPVVRWDGYKTQVQDAGVRPPATACTVSGTGAGDIVGEYFAFVRFVNEHNEYSNLSPLSAKYTALGTSGTVTAASKTTPIVLTSAAHGLTTGTTVRVRGVGGNRSANGTWAITVLDGDTFELDGSTAVNSYTGGGTWTAGVDTIVYSSVPVPADPGVRRRQVLRNTDGVGDVFYVDVDTTDLSSSTLSSTKNDSLLAAGEAQAIVGPDGSAPAERYGVPPNWKTCLCHHLDRMFLAGQVDYSQGNVKVTRGSLSVTGVGTAWKAGLEGRYLYVTGARRTYQVDAVDEAAQTLTLTEPYAGDADNFALYAIRPAPAERKLVYYSEAGLPAAWPATSAFSVQEDGDEIVGLMPRGSFLYVLERRHVYKMTFETDPARDGAVFMSANRGCVNNRCWVLVDDAAFMLDELGLHKFDSGGKSTHLSGAIQEIFRPGAPDHARVNWQARDWFHAVLYTPQDTIRWFVALSGQYLPRHAICYNYRTERFWTEAFPFPIGGSCRGTTGGVPRVFLGGPARKVYAFWEGNLDGADPKKGTVRGTATSATMLTLTDAGAAFDRSSLSAQLSIVSGTGKGQARKVVEVNATTLQVDLPWAVKPDATSVYQVGGVPWRFRSNWFRFAQTDNDSNRRLEVVYRPASRPAVMDLAFRYDFAAAAEAQRVTQGGAAGGGVASLGGQAALEIDLTQPSGVVQHNVPGHREALSQGRRYSQYELSGVTNQDDVKVYQTTYDGVLPPSKPTEDQSP